MSPSPSSAERVQKLLADAGLGSRRALDARLMAGEVLLNGQPAQPGATAKIDDVVAVDGLCFVVVSAAAAAPRVLVYNKPEGEVVSAADPEGRPTVFERLPRIRPGRWINVGRLDINTSGLLLFTDSGDLAHALMHPSFEIERSYLCRLRQAPSAEAIAKLRRGVDIDGQQASFGWIEALGGDSDDVRHPHYLVGLREGRNREVRKLWEAVGCEISRLKRTAYGPIALDKALARGQYRPATAEELAALCSAVNLPEAGQRLTLQRQGSAMTRPAARAPRHKPGPPRGTYKSRR